MQLINESLVLSYPLDRKINTQVQQRALQQSETDKIKYFLKLPERANQIVKIRFSLIEILLMNKRKLKLFLINLLGLTLR